MKNINFDYVTEYIKSVQPELSGLEGEIEKFANENDVPIVDFIMHRFLATMLTMKKPKNILEVGCAIGFSSIFMSKYASGKIVTLERNPRMLERAEKNIKEAKLEDKIEIMFGDAIENINKLEDKFDVIFIDAAKSKYQEFFDASYRVLEDDGLIICDNVLNKGMVAKDVSEVDRRHRTTHRNMNKFIENMMNDDRFESVLLPFADGVLLSYRKEGK